jgi:hypothetical protein
MVTRGQSREPPREDGEASAAPAEDDNEIRRTKRTGLIISALKGLGSIGMPGMVNFFLNRIFIKTVIHFRGVIVYSDP